MELDINALKKGREYKKIRANLIDILKNNGSDIPVFESLVNDYMSLWLTKELLRIDIETEGIKTKYNNGGGQEGDKVNPSVDKLRQINAQMSKLLVTLDITPEKVASLVVDEL